MASPVLHLTGTCSCILLASYARAMAICSSLKKMNCATLELLTWRKLTILSRSDGGQNPLNPTRQTAMTLIYLTKVASRERGLHFLLRNQPNACPPHGQVEDKLSCSWWKNGGKPSIPARWEPLHQNPWGVIYLHITVAPFFASYFSPARWKHHPKRLANLTYKTSCNLKDMQQQ